MENLRILFVQFSSSSLTIPLQVDFPLLVVTDSFEKALEWCEESAFEVVVIEGESGESLLPFLRGVRQRSSLTRFLFLSPHPFPSMLSEIAQAGIEGFFHEIPDPFRVRQALSLIAKTFFRSADHAKEKSRLIQAIAKEDDRVMMLIEVDHLDNYHTVFSLAFIDAILQEVGDFLEHYKPDGSEIFSISEEKYAILMEDENTFRAEDFATILNVLILDRKIYVKKQEVDVSFSVGVAKGRGETLLSKAYAALRKAKESGHKHVVLAEDDEEFRFFQRENLRWMRGVRHALEEDRIVPYYQPIINNATGKIEKYECLARLIDHEVVVPPAIFLQSARQIGLMSNVTFAIINKSLTLFQNNDMELSINIAEEDIRDAKIIRYLLNRCERYGIDPSRIVIEILEDITFGRNNKSLEHMRYLHQEGFKIAIDDFGFENSNFGRLIDMEVDYIKIDGSFVKNMETDDRSYKIVDSIAKFCKSIGAKSIAEYVHSQGVQERVLALGIDYSQGYFFGKATPKPLEGDSLI